MRSYNGGRRTSELKEEEDGLARTKILGALSSVFDPFMDGYVPGEAEFGGDVLQRTVSEDTVDRDGALPVLASSVHVFAYIKASVRRCTALATGQTFFKSIRPSVNVSKVMRRGRGC